MLLVGNGLLITRDNKNTIIQNGCAAIEGDTIIETGLAKELRSKYSEAAFIDAEHKMIMPGLINTHMHFYSTFARGMALKDPPPANFLEILERLWWRLDKTLTLEDVYYSAMVTVMDCIKNGVTTVFDHHASPNSVEGSLFKIAEATRTAGLRACLCYEVSDRDGLETADRGIRENVDFISYCGRERDPMLKGMFGLHASLTLSDRTLEKCIDSNSGTGVGFHIHAAEGSEDLKNARDKYGMGVIERLQASQILGEKSLAAHCVHISGREIGILGESGTNVIHNPESNMGNAVGTAPVLEMMDRGVLVGLGTDGYTSDMLESMKAANCLHKHVSRHPSTAWGEPPRMLFENNAAIAGKFFDKPLGILSKGAYADLVIVDYDPPTPVGFGNINSHILFGASGRAMDTVIINGRVVMENRKLTRIDDMEICAKSRELARKVWERF